MSQISVLNVFFSQIEPLWAMSILFVRKSHRKMSETVVPTERELNIGGSQISVLTIYFCELDHSKWYGVKKIKKFRRIIQYGHFRSIWLNRKNCIFWTRSFLNLKLLLTLSLSTISESLRKIPTQKNCQKNRSVKKNTVLDVPEFFWTPLFEFHTLIVRKFQAKKLVIN